MRALRKRVWSYIRSSRGDTLVEALAALLIAAMGAALLATMVMVSMNITVTNQKNLEANYQAEQKMGIKDSRALATIKLGLTAEAYLSVVAYQSADGTFTRYENEFDRSMITP